MVDAASELTSGGRLGSQPVADVCFPFSPRRLEAICLTVPKE